MAALIQKLAGAGGTGPPKAAAGAGLLCPICGLARCSLGGRPSLGRHAASLALLGPSINEVCEDFLILESTSSIWLRSTCKKIHATSRLRCERHLWMVRCPSLSVRLFSRRWRPTWCRLCSPRELWVLRGLFCNEQNARSLHNVKQGMD